MRLTLAFKIFLETLFSKAVAEQVKQTLETPALPAPKVKEKVKEEEKPKKPPKPVPPPKPARSEALTLLAALQRESRLVDIVKEPLDSYSDEQVGAAARDVLKNCAKVLDRLFALEPLADQEEGAEVTLEKGFDAEKYRLTGNVEGQPPFHGNLVHHGWKASKCELPAWNGSESGAKIVAPAEVEVRS